MSNKNNRSKFNNQIYFKVNPTQVTLIPGQVIYITEPKTETNSKMKAEKWSTAIAKSRHYMFICADGRMATLLPLSSEPPKNPFQIQFKDTMRSGLDLTIRCDQKCKIPLSRLTEGKYSNFRGISYSFDRETTMKLLGYSMMYEMYQNFSIEDVKTMLDYAWADLPEMLNSFKGQFNNMEYDFRHGPQMNYDDTDMTEDDTADIENVSEPEVTIPETSKLDTVIDTIIDKINVLSDKVNLLSMNQLTAPTSVTEEATAHDEPVEEVAIEETPVVEEKQEVATTVEKDDKLNPSEDACYNGANDIITGGDEKDISKDDIDDEVGEVIQQHQVAINTFALRKNIEIIREARGNKVEPVAPVIEEESKVEEPVVTEVAETATTSNEPKVEESITPVEDSNRNILYSEFSIIDSMKFPKLPPLSAKGDSIKAFVDNECVKREREFTSLRVLFTVFKKYCQSTGLWCPSLGDLKCYLILNGYRVERLMIDQKDRPLDAVNIVLKSQLNIIEKTKQNMGLNDENASVVKDSPKEEPEKDNVPVIPRKNDRVVWNSELVEYATKLVNADPDKAIELFHYKNVKSLRTTIAKFKREFASK